MCTNTIFGVAHAAGRYTAWSDKHASYSAVSGPGDGTNLDDYYSPDINSAVVALSGVTTPLGLSGSWILQNRDDKFSDFGSLERQVAILRGEIERIEAERSASRSRVSFANVFFSLRQERTSIAETIGAKLRSAAIGGLNDALDSLSSILLFMAGHGPLLVLWAVLIYFPARYFWRRRSQLAFSEAQAPRNS